MSRVARVGPTTPKQVGAKHQSHLSWQFIYLPTAARDAGPGTPAVLITAHGISDRERRRLEADGKRLIDTTCPLVERVHRTAQQLQADGYHVLVIGRRGHVEVETIVGDLDDPDVIESAEEVDVYPHPRLGTRL